MNEAEKIRITTAESDQDLQGILSLQQQNLPKNISVQELNSQGFVTIEHSLVLLQKMHTAEKSIIAKIGDRVIGYNLAMTKDFASEIPVLSHMFSQIEKITYNDMALDEINFIICGQVCVAKDYRGIGLMDRMYLHYRDVHKPKYSMILTEIADHNPRSVKAHLRVGFEIIHSYSSPNDTRWHIVIWNW